MSLPGLVTLADRVQAAADAIEQLRAAQADPAALDEAARRILFRPGAIARIRLCVRYPLDAAGIDRATALLTRALAAQGLAVSLTPPRVELLGSVSGPTVLTWDLGNESPDPLPDLWAPVRAVLAGGYDDAAGVHHQGLGDAIEAITAEPFTQGIDLERWYLAQAEPSWLTESERAWRPEPVPV